MTKKAEPIDMIEQVGRLLELFSDGQDLARRNSTYDTDATILLASVGLAVAGEIRDLRNVVHEMNMRQAGGG